jgi:anti-sigma B factor antagonist
LITEVALLLHIEREIHDFVVLTRVRGEVDLTVVHAVRQAFATALALTTPPFPVVIDLDGVTFLGSRGLSEVLAAARAARKRGVSLRIVATRREVLRPLVVTGILRMLDVRRTLEEALSSTIPATTPANQN